MSCHENIKPDISGLSRGEQIAAVTLGTLATLVILFMVYIIKKRFERVQYAHIDACEIVELN